MRRTLSDVTVYAVLGGAAVVAVALLHGGDTALAADAYLLFLGALAVLVATRLAAHLAGGSGPSELDALVRPEKPHVWQRLGRPERQQLPELARVEREVSLACGSAFDLHVRLRPTLQEIADLRLQNRYGIGLDDRRAPELLGETTWDVVRPDRQPPAYRHAAGLSVEELAEIVGTLERL